MNSNDNLSPSRRDFLKTSAKATVGGVAAVSGLTSLGIPAVHAAGSDLIQVAFVGCGGRGSGAAVQALSTKNQGPIKIVAMADAFDDRLQASYKGLSTHPEVGKLVDVPKERQFVGWDAYKKAMDVLKPGDVVILTTPPAFRWVHFTYAISKGLNVFMEKPVTVDGPTTRRMIKLAADASAKNLKCGVGLMSRHYKPLQDLHSRIQNGEMGEILLMRGYRMHGPGGSFQSIAKPEGISHLDYQVRRFHSFLWASGGNFSDFYIHHVDHLCWMKNAWPVKAQGVGGRHYKTDPEGRPWVDQNFDAYSVEYTFADGTKFIFDGRCMDGAQGIYSSYVHGTKGMAVAARHNDYNGPAAIYKGQNEDPTKVVWESTDNNNPYQTEWDVLISAIRNDKPHNEVKRGAEASLVTSMGRMAAHTGVEITYDQILNSTHEFAPDLDKLTKDSTAPLMPDASGFYPKPKPGIVIAREY
jgi:predicted dehydrogenase